ncbi:hypothetical protein [Companilactobacillus paralimentarius]|uniref:hypothetical protein n=1 Tax=Companilactobacillus paralimentarius TaxID=83526 RepID=UPI00384FFA09
MAVRMHLSDRRGKSKSTPLTELDKAKLEIKELKARNKYLEMENDDIDSKGLILYIDQGSAYTSLEFNKTLDGYGIRHSMSKSEISGDNSTMESF